VPIRAGQTHGERHASPVANQMALTPALGPIGRVRTSLVIPMHRADGTTVRPPFGRRGGVSKNDSTRSHYGSGSSVAAIPVHATSPTRIRGAAVLLRRLSA